MSEASGSSALPALLEDSTTHAARNLDSEVQPVRAYVKLTDAQQASRNLLTASTKAKKKDLTTDIDALLIDHAAAIKAVAKTHDVQPDYILKLISTSSRYKAPRAPTLHNAMMHAKAQEINEGNYLFTRHYFLC